MLERIEVDGFKSLTDFSLDIRPGLNILVGPNGSGKSNIILFFEFLSHLADGSVMQAISRIGGAGSVFSLLGDGQLKQRLSFSISGSAEFRSRYKNQKKKRVLGYEYRATVQLSIELGTLTFVHQEIRLREGDVQQPHLSFATPAPAFEMLWQLSDKGEARTSVSALDETLFVPFYFRESDKSFNAIEFIGKSFNEEPREFALFYLLSRYVEPVRIIDRDFIAGRAYNIDPNAVRQPEDIASIPGIQFDGKGLAATLFASKKQARGYNIELGPYLPNTPSLPADLVKDVSRYAQLVNDSIDRIEVDQDPFENKLLVWLVQRPSKDGLFELRMPLRLASDGTVKWLALTTAVLSNRTALAIEEPENFLHPYMQAEIIDMIRRRTKRQRMFALVTTHSETLLNAVEPAEVIVISRHDGVTLAARPSNTSDLAGEIRETGFGLGYFYVAGALD